MVRKPETVTFDRDGSIVHQLREGVIEIPATCKHCLCVLMLEGAKDSKGEKWTWVSSRQANCIVTCPNCGTEFPFELHVA